MANFEAAIQINAPTDEVWRVLADIGSIHALSEKEHPMSQVFARFLIYTVLPPLLAAVHVKLDNQARTRPQKIEIFLLYLFGLGVGAGGFGGFFGHFFLSDLVAESIGWPAGNPFQLEMAFANLSVGVLGFIAMTRRDGFRLATVIAAAILAYGATVVHGMDIIATGNLAPGNTAQNLSNVIKPTLLILLLIAGQRAGADPLTARDERWLARQAPLVIAMAMSLGTGFGVGFSLGQPLLGVLMGLVLGGVLVGGIRAREGRPAV